MCKALTKKGSQCSRTGKYEGYCKVHFKNKDIPIIVLPKCPGITRKGKLCCKNGRYDGYCKSHSPVEREKRHTNIVKTYGIIEAKYSEDGWKIIVCCILLNLTTCHQVRKMIDEFFDLYPTPQSIIDCDSEKLKKYIQPLGLYNRRVKSLKKFSQDYIDNKDIKDCFGVGKYAHDAYEIFFNKNLDVLPTDGALKAHLEVHHNIKI